MKDRYRETKRHKQGDIDSKTSKVIHIQGDIDRGTETGRQRQGDGLRGEVAAIQDIIVHY